MSTGKWQPFCLGLNELSMEYERVPAFHNERSKNYLRNLSVERWQKIKIHFKVYKKKNQHKS